MVTWKITTWIKLLDFHFRNQFTAKPVNKKIFTNPNSGVPEVQKKSVTIPDEFNLRGNHKDHQNKSTEEEKYEFHARPVSKRILDGVVVGEHNQPDV